MNDVLSSSFKRYTDLKQQVFDDEMEYRNETANLDKFFRDVDNVKADITATESLYRNLIALNENSKTIHDERKMKGLREKMDGDVLQVVKLVKNVKQKLEALERSNAAQRAVHGCGPGSSTDQTRSAVLNGLRQKLKEMMDEFQRLRDKIASDHHETLRRYITITGAVPNEEMIESLIASGQSEDFLQKAIQDQGRGSIMDIISEIHDRHDAVKEIERNLTELHQVFLDMAVVVESQGYQLNDIESHVARATSFVSRGVETLQDAKQYQKSSRKWTVVAIFAGALLVVIILIPLLPILLPPRS